MRNLVKSVLIMIGLVIAQFSLYDLLLKPIITTWGTSAAERSLPMAGDSPALTITSTRAILIDAPKSAVWQWLMQLGADRGGFYSYTFIEQALGYKTRHQDLITPEFKTLAVGDLVRGSIHPDSSIVPYNFRVLYVKPEDALVLDQWGSFLLQAVNDQQTRLIIRTQVAKSTHPWQQVTNAIIIPLHFIMERRTLIGLKARAEAGENVYLSNSADKFWFSAIVLSGVLIIVFIVLGRGFMQSILMPLVLSGSWMALLLLLDPSPLYSIGFLIIMCAALLYLIETQKEH